MKSIKVVLLTVLYAIFAGCATQPTIEGTIDPHSKFAKLTLGMSRKEATDILGPPTATGTHHNKLLDHIPVPYGVNDAENGYFWDDYYKAQGELMFEGIHNPRLVKIVADKNESGYQK
ncbi:hypothetical protein [Sideroxydans sp. CL21]|uniref:hypothetical protein n=1 Tax=Sideroxydans sp. CL21 TaxID=2600596 RepID=UPI0024BBF71A|nr:hypothetical protein [Sideroxydans sp. CL21]